MRMSTSYKGKVILYIEQKILLDTKFSRTYMASDTEEIWKWVQVISDNKSQENSILATVKLLEPLSLE